MVPVSCCLTPVGSMKLREHILESCWKPFSYNTLSKQVGCTISGFLSMFHTRQVMGCTQLHLVRRQRKVCAWRKVDAIKTSHIWSLKPENLECHALLVRIMVSSRRMEPSDFYINTWPGVLHTHACLEGVALTVSLILFISFIRCIFAYHLH